MNIVTSIDRHATSTTSAPAPVPVSPWIWPGLLILGPASVVVACIITAYFVLQHPDALVASDYYKAGKAINAQLSQLDRAKQLGMDTMKISVSDTVVTLQFPDARDTSMIDITLAHPVDPDRDIRKTLSASASGIYVVTLPASLAERRRVVVTDSPAHSWRVESLLVPAQPKAR
jgi:uncharacterized protein